MLYRDSFSFDRFWKGKIMKTLLIIEDDRTLGQGIKLALQSEVLEVKISHCLEEARTELESRSFNLLILDINLPDGNGLDFLMEIRKSSTVPVILLTAHDMETDIVMGLESGADDYVTKPFSLAVLRARVNTQLRKTLSAPNNIMTIDAFQFDFERMEFRKNGQEISLSKTEQKLLKILVTNRKITLSRAELVDRIWTDGAEYVDENALSVTVKRLRDKLEDMPSKPHYLKTVYGIGYTWEGK